MSGLVSGTIASVSGHDGGYDPALSACGRYASAAGVWNDQPSRSPTGFRSKLGHNTRSITPQIPECRYLPASAKCATEDTKSSEESLRGSSERSLRLPLTASTPKHKIQMMVILLVGKSRSEPRARAFELEVKTPTLLNNRVDVSMTSNETNAVAIAPATVAVTAQAVASADCASSERQAKVQLPVRLDLQGAPGTLKAHRPVVLGFPGAAGHVVATEVPVSMVPSEALMPPKFLVIMEGQDIDDILVSLIRTFGELGGFAPQVQLWMSTVGYPTELELGSKCRDKVVSIQNARSQFDGTVSHMVLPFEGGRVSLLYFTRFARDELEATAKINSESAHGSKTLRADWKPSVWTTF